MSLTWGGEVGGYLRGEVRAPRLKGTTKVVLVSATRPAVRPSPFATPFRPASRVPWFVPPGPPRASSHLSRDVVDRRPSVAQTFRSPRPVRQMAASRCESRRLRLRNLPVCLSSLRKPHQTRIVGKAIPCGTGFCDASFGVIFVSKARGMGHVTLVDDRTGRKFRWQPSCRWVAAAAQPRTPAARPNILRQRATNTALPRLPSVPRRRGSRTTSRQRESGVTRRKAPGVGAFRHWRGCYRRKSTVAPTTR